MVPSKQAKVVEAATSVFLRYGFRRTTMGDIATAAGVSRPALYLLFCNKERIFEAVLEAVSSTILEDIRNGIARADGPMAKLKLAFELWAVRPFTLMLESPDARDLVQEGCGSVRGVLDQSQAAFEALLVPVLEALRGPESQPGPEPARVARLLAASVRGFKDIARDPAELRGMIEDLLRLTTLSPA
ncbi:MAG TPA: helix-turn-helix domain-containing protein [Holophaga sp.]|nr:helix-turn-helix domain-containing protein [Holophaga sp.]